MNAAPGYIIDSDHDQDVKKFLTEVEVRLGMSSQWSSSCKHDAQKGKAADRSKMT